MGRAVTISLSGPVAAFSAGGLNLNSIAATADGNTLIVDNTVLDKLFTVNPATGASAPINVVGLIPDSMDGMLLEGSSRWVVENTANTVLRVGRYDLGLPPPFGPGAPPGTTFNVVVTPAF